MVRDLLFRRDWPGASLAEDIARMDVAAYAQAYADLKAQAPLTGRIFARDSMTDPVTAALVNAQPLWCLPDGTRFDLLDNQVPLNVARADRDIGKIALFGLSEDGRAVLVVLKGIGAPAGAIDPPPAALIDGLRHAAVIEANLARLAAEVSATYGRAMVRERPALMILGAAGWWSRWLDGGTNVTTALAQKTRALADAIDMTIVFASLTETRIDQTPRNKAPRLPVLAQIAYDPALPASAIKAAPGHAKPPVDHETRLQQRWWRYAATLATTDLDGQSRPGRPPVVSGARASANLLLPPDSAMASAIEMQIPVADRHRHFRSFRSSQALAQSVFGALKAADRLDLLAQIPAECGRPAFGPITSGTAFSMEVDVRTLREPRPTQLDLCLQTEGYRVAVECKFCEPAFGTCSRVRSKTGVLPVCDGTYRFQQGRATRCALSDIGVAYWEFIPELFDWESAEDLSPCPLLPTYQIVRNVLAAVVDHSGRLQPAQGHATIVYDRRNPAYRIGGVADGQLRQAAAACRVPGLIRRVSWQEIMRPCAGLPDLAWLAEAVTAKHGICHGGGQGLGGDHADLV